jgi:hypothetical protein
LLLLPRLSIIGSEVRASYYFKVPWGFQGILIFALLICGQVCAGDLGTDAELLEANLLEITSLSHKWGAIILIDEADVYLAERALQDIQRNALVSVFLRHLKYFQGIMFLTTNRVATFDLAFQ